MISTRTVLFKRQTQSIIPQRLTGKACNGISILFVDLLSDDDMEICQLFFSFIKKKKTHKGEKKWPSCRHFDLWSKTTVQELVVCSIKGIFFFLSCCSKNLILFLLWSSKFSSMFTLLFYINWLHYIMTKCCKSCKKP